jgi:hypothetical protein
MKHLEVSGAVQHIYMSLGGQRLNTEGKQRGGNEKCGEVEKICMNARNERARNYRTEEEW